MRERPLNDETPAEREILTVEQAAGYLEIHKVTVYRKDVEALLAALRTGEP